MIDLAENVVQGKGVHDLRARIAQVRQALTDATEAYRDAAAQHDSALTIPLLRSRSRLMRELLETQCELLLAFRSESSEGDPRMAAADRIYQ